jgi:hypothetical protein
MMKVLDATASISFVVDTDDKEWSTYRRHSEDIWECLMGESWEPVYSDRKIEELEDAFVKYFLKI